MAETAASPGTDPVSGRIRRHVDELVRLAGPTVVSRAGVMVMALVDTVMLGRYSAQELAYMGIAMAPVMPLLLVGLGLVMGTLVMTAAANGAGRDLECGAVWRRSLGYGAAIGGVFAVVLWFGEPLLLLFGQTGDLAAGGGAVTRILGLGLPPLMLFLTTTFFLEGIKRPLPSMVLMLAANVLNVFLNWVLIYGHFGFPALGAVGSAWATTGVRLFLGVGLVAYVWMMVDRERFGVRLRPSGGWRAWAAQRRLGYAAAVAIGLEATAFSVVNVFAGWLGPLPLAGYAIALNMISLVFMVAVGLGSATAVRVGFAHGRGDRWDLAVAGWTGLGVNTMAMAAFAILFALAPGVLVSGYTDDPLLVAVTLPAIAYCAWVLVFDGGQAVMANALRGRGDTWVTASLQGFSYFVVQLPVSYVLAFPLGRGLVGLFEGILIASVIAVVLLSVRFQALSTQDRRMAPVSPSSYDR